MDHFILHSEYAPTGDQPQAIEELVKGFKEGNQFQTLLGVTGSGKTFTMANVIAKLNLPTPSFHHYKLNPDNKQLEKRITNSLAIFPIGLILCYLIHYLSMIFLQ